MLKHDRCRAGKNLRLKPFLRLLEPCHRTQHWNGYLESCGSKTIQSCKHYQLSLCYNESLKTKLQAKHAIVFVQHHWLQRTFHSAVATLPQNNVFFCCCNQLSKKSYCLWEFPLSWKFHVVECLVTPLANHWNPHQEDKKWYHEQEPNTWVQLSLPITLQSTVSSMAP